MLRRSNGGKQEPAREIKSLWIAGGMRCDSNTWLSSVQGSWLRSRTVHEVSLEVFTGVHLRSRTVRETSTEVFT